MQRSSSYAELASVLRSNSGEPPLHHGPVNTDATILFPTTRIISEKSSSSSKPTEAPYFPRRSRAAAAVPFLPVSFETFWSCYVSRVRLSITNR